MEKDLHAVQASILKALLFRETARFSELNTDNVSTDRFSFHVRQLVEGGIIEKMKDQSYRLTIAGKEYANRFDVDSGPVRIEKQAKLAVFVVAMQEHEGKRRYVMQHRLKHPFFGFRGFVTGKIKIGESVREAAERELLEETGLCASCEHKAVYHERIFSPQNELLEDKYFFIFLARNPTGELVSNFEGGRNEWIGEEDVLKGNTFYDIRDILGLLHANHTGFAEKSYTVEKY